MANSTTVYRESSEKLTGGMVGEAKVLVNEPLKVFYTELVIRTEDGTPVPAHSIIGKHNMNRMMLLMMVLNNSVNALTVAGYRSGDIYDTEGYNSDTE